MGLSCTYEYAAARNKAGLLKPSVYTMDCKVSSGLV